jgi:hypothetical protein
MPACRQDERFELTAWLFQSVLSVAIEASTQRRRLRRRATAVDELRLGYS